MSSHQFSSSIYWDSLFFSHTNKQKQCRDDIYRTQKSSTIGVPITPGAVPKKKQWVTDADATRSGSWTKPYVVTTHCARFVWAGATARRDFIIPGSSVTFARSKRKRGRLLEKRLRERQQRNDKLKLVPFSFLISLHNKALWAISSCFDKVYEHQFVSVLTFYQTYSSLCLYPCIPLNFMSGL